MAIKKRLFKIFEESSFYLRNRYLAKNHILSKQQGLRFDINYKIQSGSIIRIPGGISLTAGSVFESEAFLKGNIIMYKNGALHTYLDEINPLFPRFRPSPNDILNQSVLEKLEDENICITEDMVTWEFSNIKYKLTFNPLKLEGFYKDELVIVANSKSLMNFERYRPKNEESFNNEVDANVPISIIDATQVIEELEEGYKKIGNLWSEEYLDYIDEKPRGPSSVALDFEFVDASHVYGIPEHADSLALRDTTEGSPYRLFNCDNFAYKLGNTGAIYGAVPFMVSRSSTLKSAGIFWLNSSETWIDIETLDQNKHSHWISEAGALEFFLFVGNSPLSVIETYTLLTGPAQMPPLSVLGYHQCRWNYNSREDLLEVSNGFLENSIPLDVVWLDIEHTDKKKYFTWDDEKFPDPTSMQEILAKQGRNLVTIVDPHIKRDPEYFVHQDSETHNYYVTNNSGQSFEGVCWPGMSSWLDFTRPEVREYWSSNFDYSKYLNSTNNLYIWNDMNEPSVFNSPEGTMPRGNLHGNYEHREVHNTYGMYMQQASYQGLLKRSQAKERPFILTRSFFAGTQKYGAIWTGDNVAEWGYLDYSTPMHLSIAIGGISFCGSDVGGFFGDPDKALLVRWYQLGAYYPFFRGHAHIESERREPWLFGDEVLRKIRAAIKERYALLPYWYGLFYLYRNCGTPVIRPMFVEYPEVKECAGLDRQFLVGNSLLVAGVSKEMQENVDVFLPEGRWFDYHTLLEVNSGQQSCPVQEDWIPVFIKGGSIIPRKNYPRMSSKEMFADPYSFLIAIDSNDTAEGFLYADDTISHNFMLGQYILADIQFKNFKLSYNLTNTMELANNIEEIMIIGLSKIPNEMILDIQGQKKPIEFGVRNNIIVINSSEITIDQNWSIEFKYN